MPKIPDSTRQPSKAYEALASSIRQSIADGDLAEGQRLPSESRLALEAGVSRSTVREALRLLQESGFLERVSPRILVVRSDREAPAFRAMTHALRRRTVTFAALHESLLLLEPELARLAAQRRDEDDLAALRSLLDAQRKNRVRFAEWCRLDESFHVAIAEASANAPLVLARATLGQLLVPTVAQFVHSDRATTAAIEFHERIYAEIERGDAEFAELIARRHVEDFHAAWEASGLAYEQDISQLIDAATARPNLGDGSEPSPTSPGSA